MFARLFPYIKKTHLYITKAFLLGFVFFLTIFFWSPQKTVAADCTQEGPRHIDCYLILWGSNFKPSENDIHSGKASGILYLGPVQKEDGGFETDGTLKKISIKVSLSLDPDDLQYRPWNMVGGIVRSAGSLLENKKYLRLLDESFIARIYQLDSNNQVINESISEIPSCSFLDCDEKSLSSLVNLEELLTSNRSLDYIVKFQSGAAFFNRGGIFNRTDGYSEDGSGWGVNRVTGTIIGLVTTRSIKGAVAGNISGKFINYFETSGPIFILNQIVVPKVEIKSTLKKGEPTYLELWYLGSDRIKTGTSFDPAGKASGTVPLYPTTPPYRDTDNERIKYFGYRNGGENFPYFKIGDTFTFTTPRDASAAELLAVQATIASTTSQGNLKNDENPESSTLPACSITNGKILWGTVGVEGSFLGCIAQFVYYVIFEPIKWFAGLMGSLFDFFLGYSLDDSSYRADFVVSAWKIVRDISNIFFIIILVWTGLSTALGIEGISMKKVVPTLIVNALIINFSLFATRIVVDISNIFARVFYNKVQIVRKDADTGIPQDANKAGTGGYKPLSEKIVAGFDPQKLFAAKYLSTASYNGTTFKGALDETRNQDAGKGSLEVDRTTSNYAAYYILVSLLAAAIVMSVAIMFWKSAFFFLGRVVGIYVVMIFSPFAFLTRGNMPLVGSIQRLKWDDWVSELTKYALLAPIFMFFLYIVYLLVNSEFLYAGIGQNSDSFLTAILQVAIPMLIIYFMIAQGVSIAKTYAGYVGDMVQSKIQSITGGIGGLAGAGVGVAAGAAAFAGRNVVGRGMRFFGKTKTGRKVLDKDGNEIDETREMNWAANADNSKWARFMNYANNKSQTGSWDIRNAGVKVGKKEYTAGGTFAKGFGLFSGGEKVSDTVSDSIGLGQDKAVGKGDKPGGIIKLDEEREKARAEKLKSEISFSHLEDDTAQNVWAAVKKKKIEEAANAYWTEDNGKNKAALTAAQQKLEELKQHTEKAEKDLEEAKKKNDTSLVASIEAFITQNKEAQESKEKEIADINGKAGKEESDRLNKYGNIKNKAGLEAAMRGEYAEDLRKNSFWLKDGKSRYWPGIVGSAVASALSIIAPGFGTAIGGIMLANMTDGLSKNAFGNINDRATKRIINEARKSQGRGNQETQFSEKMQDLNDILCSAVNKHLGTAYKKFEDMTLKQMEEGVDYMTLELEEKMEELKTKQPKGWKLEMQKHKRHIAKLRNAIENYEKYDEKLTKMKNDKAKSAEEKNKPKDDNKKP